MGLIYLVKYLNDLLFFSVCVYVHFSIHMYHFTHMKAHTVARNELSLIVKHATFVNPCTGKKKKETSVVMFAASAITENSQSHTSYRAPVTG